MKKSDLRVQKTIKAIDDAVWLLLKKKNFEEITVHDISELACINRITFYRHYVDKYQWMDHTFDQLFKRYHSIFAVLFSNNAESEYRKALDKAVQIYAEQFTQLSLLMNNSGVQFHNRHIGTLLIIAKQHPFFDTDPGPAIEFWLQYLVTTLVGIFEWWIQNQKPIPEELLTKNLYHVYGNLITALQPKK